MTLPKWLQFLRDDEAVEPGDALILDGSDIAEIELGIGDVAIFHGDLSDYTAEILDIQPATTYLPEYYRLRVYTDRDMLDWIWCRAERLTLLMKAAALTSPNEVQTVSAVS